MKKLLVAALIILAFAAGFSCGVWHAVIDSAVYPEGDYVIIELDGEMYLHGPL